MVTVIVPVHNSQGTVDIAVESIRNQTFTDLDIVLVDDASTDGSLTKLYDHAASDDRIRIVTLDEPSLSRTWRGTNVDAGYRARNHGLAVARGDWITFQDADDFSLENRIEIQLEIARMLETDHVTTDVFWLKEEAAGKRFDLDRFLVENDLEAITTTDATIKQLAADGIGPLSRRCPAPVFSHIPFRLKTGRPMVKAWFGHFLPYPGAGNICLFRSELAQMVRFRSFNERLWPSRRGRGADRDFNFQLSLQSQNSVSVAVPLYAWRTPTPFGEYEEVQRFLI